MAQTQFLSAAQAIRLIPSGAVLGTGGFVGCGQAEELAAALERRFLTTNEPRDLTLVFAAGQGDGKLRGLNHLGHEGLLRRAIGGHWNLVPQLAGLALAGKIEAYNFPQGVISKLFREAASGNPGMLSRVGPGTLVDPANGGGKIGDRTSEDLVERMTIDGVEMLWYRAPKISAALLRGTSSDSGGNISMEHETITGEMLAIAQAAHRNGGPVIVQVERIVPDHSRDPKSICIPGIFVDAVVVTASGENHWQTYDYRFNASYVQQGPVTMADLQPLPAGPRRWIAARCLEELRAGDVVNLGIGMAEGIAPLACEKGLLDSVTLTVEAGAIGGVPAGGLSFGASFHPQAIIDQPSMFDFYDGGGLDVAFLSMAECDAEGNVNVSRYGGRMPGIGGFMNIAHTAKRVVFLGTFTAGGFEAEFAEERVRIVREGSSRKFVPRVEQISFCAATALKNGQQVMYVTERAVFRLTPSGLELVEVAAGIELSRDVFGQMGFRPEVAADCRTMAPRFY